MRTRRTLPSPLSQLLLPLLLCLWPCVPHAQDVSPEHEAIIDRLAETLAVFDKPVHYELKQVARRAESVHVTLAAAIAANPEPPFWKDALISQDERGTDFRYAEMSIQVGEGGANPEQDYTHYLRWHDSEGVDYRENAGGDKSRSALFIHDTMPKSLDFALTPGSVFNGPPGFVGLRRILGADRSEGEGSVAIEHAEDRDGVSVFSMSWTSEDGTRSETWQLALYEDSLCPVEGHAVVNGVSESRLEVLATATATLHDTLTHYPSRIRYESTSEAGFDSWEAEVYIANSFAFVYSDEYKIQPLPGLVAQNRSAEDQSPQPAPGLEEQIRQRLASRMQQAIPAVRRLEPLSAPQSSLHDEASESEVNEFPEDSTRYPVSGDDHTYLILTLPVVILLLGIGAALAYHKVLR